VLKLSRILPAGHSFPFDFGSIPGTRAEDGDALDVMVLAEEPSFPGCLLQVRLIGVLTGRQTEKGRTIRNDRLLAVPETEVNKPFFVSYNLAQGRKFKPGRPQGPRAAEQRLRAAIARFRRRD
jgi:inorganic pyrophosphatase